MLELKGIGLRRSGIIYQALVLQELAFLVYLLKNDVV
jgi:hypothetical protein